MKTIIAGSRRGVTYAMVEKAIALSNFKITEIVSGTAKGADTCGEFYAELNNILIKKMPADWERYGKSAGYKRNADMATYADACILIWDGSSKGSRHMRDLAIKHKLKLYVYLFDTLSNII